MKRKGKRHSVELLLISLLALTIGASCTGSKSETTNLKSALPNAFHGNFVIRLISVQPDMDKAFIAHLHDCLMPVWYQLRSDGVVSSINVFELNQMESTIAETPPWRYLLLAKLAPQATPDDLLNAEKASSCQERSDSSLFTVLRTERMSCTPNSCYAMPEPAYQDAASGIDYLIEFIDVEESSSFLTKYRDLMSSYFGPANGLLVKRGMLHCFIALETTEVLFQADGVPGWNQLHVSDHWDVGDEVDWDAVYSDLFRKEFSCELDSVWAEIPPRRESPGNYRGRLVPDLCVR